MAKSPYRTKYHRDGTVSVWDAYRQRWDRLDAALITDETLATLPPDERERIVRMASASLPFNR